MELVDKDPLHLLLKFLSLIFSEISVPHCLEIKVESRIGTLWRANGHLGKVDLGCGKRYQRSPNWVVLPVEEGGADKKGFESNGACNDEKPEQFAEVVLCGQIGEAVDGRVLKELFYNGLDSTSDLVIQRF